MAHTRDLTKAQDRALRKLIRRGGWVTPYRLGERAAVMDALVVKGYTTKRGKDGSALGSAFAPGVFVEYKATRNAHTRARKEGY